MNNTLNATIFASDKRFYTVAVLLSRANFKCSILTPESNDICESVKNANIVILPIPAFDENDCVFAKIHVDKLFSCLKSGTKVFAGKVSPIITRLAKEYNLSIYDYASREEFSILNAVPTAEGSIITYIDMSKTTVSGEKFAVLGYGKVGRALAPRLKTLGGEVYVAARSPISLANVESDGLTPIDFNRYIKDPITVDAVFNTIPSPVITDEVAYKLKDAYLIDLASKPGGATENAKKILGNKYVNALSLPGRFFPDTGGEIIYKTIIGILSEGDIQI